ncbi:ammonia-forming cytochrome c nitrite reductase subunit c552 [Desulfitispora alkaliphila]|uniref:ammonia-forming cytochrome c nitrite reductase subunit c552 n=1 Tax=Desulfitispora alkaliphila TaxID=622674 RepID=UPI003D21DA2C
MAFVFVGCGTTPDTSTPVYDTGLDADEVRNSEFGKVFPLHYASYLNNNDDTQMTEYGGSVPHDKHDGINPLPQGYKYAQPYLKNLWLGYPFSYEYKRARGHTYALEDIFHIDRIDNYSESAGLPSSCYNCKSNKVPGLLEDYGDEFWSQEFNDFRELHDIEDHAIGCNLCHDAETMELVITSEPLDEALQRLDIDWREASKNEMRSYVCAQCHVEYYFQSGDVGVAAKVTFPWDEGFGPEDMYKYKSEGSEEKGFEGAFADWVHPVSDTPMLKVQHPEFETWIDGPHGAAGVSCADCHMPYIRVDGKKKISSHQWTSPLKTIEQSCRTCHADKDAQYLKDRVVYTQEKTWEQLLIAQEISVKAHEAIRLASEFEGEKRANYDELMEEARELTRKGQWFWDYVSAENSVGFHNPQKALDTLAKSQQFSQKAVDLAKKATNYAIAPDLEGDIKEIVPPIMEHSRKLQQSKEHLESHKWFQYLPLLPEADPIWDLNERIDGN